MSTKFISLNNAKQIVKGIKDFVENNKSLHIPFKGVLKNYAIDELPSYTGGVLEWVPTQLYWLANDNKFGVGEVELIHTNDSESLKFKFTGRTVSLDEQFHSSSKKIAEYGDFIGDRMVPKKGAIYEEWYDSTTSLGHSYLVQEEKWIDDNYKEQKSFRFIPQFDVKNGDFMLYDGTFIDGSLQFRKRIIPIEDIIGVVTDSVRHLILYKNLYKYHGSFVGNTQAGNWDNNVFKALKDLLKVMDSCLETDALLERETKLCGLSTSMLSSYFPAFYNNKYSENPYKLRTRTATFNDLQRIYKIKDYIYYLLGYSSLNNDIVSCSVQATGGTGVLMKFNDGILESGISAEYEGNFIFLALYD